MKLKAHTPIKDRIACIAYAAHCYTDVALSVVCQSVCIVYKDMSCKKAELIDMPFGRLTLVGPRNDVL